MNAVFADTSYFVALLNPRDHLAGLAREKTEDLSGRLVTTWWVLVEVGNFLRAPANRQLFRALLEQLRQGNDVDIAALSQDELDLGVDLYQQRLDKSWSLTDCISFVVMQNRGLMEALTSDHHFEQAGFVRLLK